MGLRRKKPATAFTLVELLVVIGIIALLISVLLPALNRARLAANNVTCQANLRSIGQGFSLYAGRYGQQIPPRADLQPGTWSAAGDPRITNYPPATPASKHWFEYLRDTKCAADGLAYLPDAKTPDTNYIGFVRGVWRCPQIGEDQILKQASYSWGGGYGVNAEIFRYAVYVDGNLPPASGNRRVGTPKMSSIRRCASYWMAADTGRASQVSRTYFLPWDGANKPPTGGYKLLGDAGFNFRTYMPSFHHPGTRANFLFFDGHVEGRTILQCNDNEDDMFALKSTFNQ